MAWRAEVLIPAHRIVVALAGGEMVDLRELEHLRDLRRLPGAPGRGPRDDRLAQHGPPHGPGERRRRPRLPDPGGHARRRALAARGAVAGRRPHGPRDPPPLGPRLGAPPARRRRAPRPRGRARDAARPCRARVARPRDRARPSPGRRARCCRGCAGSTRPATPTATSPSWSRRTTAWWRSPGTRPGPDPSWFAQGSLPADHPRREEHLAAFRAIRDSGARLMIPGHNPPAPVEPA